MINSGKDEEDISVIRIDDLTVRCEIHSAKQSKMVDLSKALFPENIIVGQPFTLFLDKSTHYRKLLIKERVPSKEALQKGNQEMLSLLKE